MFGHSLAPQLWPPLLEGSVRLSLATHCLTLRDLAAGDRIATRNQIPIDAMMCHVLPYVLTHTQKKQKKLPKRFPLIHKYSILFSEPDTATVVTLHISTLCVECVFSSTCMYCKGIFLGDHRSVPNNHLQQELWPSSSPLSKKHVTFS